MSDVNYELAQMAEKWMESDELDGRRTCYSCDYFEECPCGCGRGICGHDEGWVSEDDPACGKWECGDEHEA